MLKLEHPQCSCDGGPMNIFMARTTSNYGHYFYRCPLRREHPGSFIWLDSAIDTRGRSTESSFAYGEGSTSYVRPPQPHSQLQMRNTSENDTATSSSIIPFQNLMENQNNMGHCIIGLVSGYVVFIFCTLLVLGVVVFRKMIISS